MVASRSVSFIVIGLFQCEYYRTILVSNFHMHLSYWLLSWTIILKIRITIKSSVEEERYDKPQIDETRSYFGGHLSDGWCLVPCHLRERFPTVAKPSHANAQQRRRTRAEKSAYAWRFARSGKAQRPLRWGIGSSLGHRTVQC